ncbi:MAG: metallothionein [bacterium]
MKSQKCACPSCTCHVDPAHAVEVDGRFYCSPLCALECTETQCVCTHDKKKCR